MTITLKGGPELLRFLDELPKNLERNVIRGGLRAGAKVIQQQAKANVPVETGQLKRAIGIGTRTDGSRLSFIGLPCPNLFTGMQAIHSKHEWIGVKDMELAVEMLIKLVQVWEEKSK